MNRRLLIVAVMGLGLGLGSQVFAQTPVPASVKAASSVADADRAVIKLFVATQVEKLIGKDAAEQTEARDALVNEVLKGSPSPAYLDAYCQVLNDALVPVAANPSVRARLNAAVVTAKVCSKAQNLRLKPVITKFVNDKSEPVVLWGVKAVGYLLPTIVRSQSSANDPLLTGLVPAIQGDLSGVVTQEAYEALSLDLSSASQRKNLTPEMILAVVPEMHKLLALRIAQYQQGMPEDPGADTLATNFLVDSLVWKAQKPAQQARTVQLTVDLLTAASHRTADYTGKGDREKKDELVQAIKRVAKGLQVIGEIVYPNNTANPLSSAAVPVTRLDVSMDTKAITGPCDNLVEAAVLAVEGVKKPAAPAGKQVSAQ